MAIHHIIAALGDHWDRVTELLGERGRAELRRHVTAMADAVTAGERAVRASRILGLLLDHLPTDDPVLTAARRAPDVPDAERALKRLAIDLYFLDTGPPAADERILAAGCESAFDLRRRGVDPDVPDLIRLDRADGSVAVPVFQFDGGGVPIPVVLRVNHLLGAREDPWGVADWWLNANVWLSDAPSTLIGDTPDDLLVAAASAAVEG